MKLANLVKVNKEMGGLTEQRKLEIAKRLDEAMTTGQVGRIADKILQEEKKASPTIIHESKMKKVRKAVRSEAIFISPQIRRWRILAGLPEQPASRKEN